MTYDEMLAIETATESLRNVTLIEGIIIGMTVGIVISFISLRLMTPKKARRVS